MKIAEIAFSCYAVTDMARSQAFYENVLGLTRTMDHDMGENGHWVEYDIGSGTLGIGRYAGWNPSKDGCTVGLEVEDFEEAVQAIAKSGAVISMGPMETPMCHMLMIQDPDGNPIILHKRKPGHA